jgi:uncharacterized protein
MQGGSTEMARAIEIAGHAAACDPGGALHVPELGLLVVSDLHLEKGSSYARRGTFLPPYDTFATLDRLGSVIARYEPRTVVCLGDSFHDPFGAERLPEPMRLKIGTLASGRDWFWVAGNHDPLPPAGLPGEAVTELAVGALSFRHEPSPGARPGEIAGHLHPGARIVRRGRSVRRACFASDGLRLVMPAFGAFTGSLNVLDRAYAGLFLWDRFRAYMLGADRVYPVARAELSPG